MAFESIDLFNQQVDLPTLFFPSLLSFSIAGLECFEIRGLTGFCVPLLVVLAVIGLVRLLEPGLAGLTIEDALSKGSPLMTGSDSWWFFWPTDGSSKSTPLTTALL